MKKIFQTRKRWVYFQVTCDWNEEVNDLSLLCVDILFENKLRLHNVFLVCYHAVTDFFAGI